MRHIRHGLGARIAAALILLGMVIIAIFLSLILTISSRAHAVHSAESSAAVLTDSVGAQKQVLDVETATRGYLLTGDRAFLAPYASGTRSLPGAIDHIEGEVRGEDEQLIRARGIGGAVAGYLNGWARPVVDGAMTTDSTSNRIALDEGKRLVDDIRRRFAQFDAVQRSVAARQSARADRLADVALGIGIGGVIVAALLITIYIVASVRLLAPVRRVSRAAGRVADGDLDVRVTERGTDEVRALSVAFNRMAGSLQEGRDEMESQNAELEAQQSELESALDVVATEKARLERFHGFAQAIAGHTDVARLSETVIEFICADAPADVGVLYVRNPGVAVYERFATRGIAATRVAAELRDSDGVAGRAIAERRVVAVNVGDDGMPVAVLGGERPARHQVSVPLLAGVQSVGVITLGRVEDRPFSDDELETVRRLADQAAVAVARSRMQLQTERSLRTIQAVLDATPDPIALVAGEGTVVFENRPMAQLRATASDEELARTAFDAPGTERDRRAEDELTLDDGHVMLRYAVPLAGEDDAPMGRIVVLRDVSAERAADQLKDEFFALVSHELRTPLTSIIGYLEMALEDDPHEQPLDPQRRQFLQVIDRNAVRLQRLVGDLLFVAQVEAGTLSLQRGEADLARIGREAVEAARPRASDAGVALSLDAPDSLPLTAADADRLGQMLDNLIVNACKFTPSGGRVSVAIEEQGGDVLLSVADTGMGIERADQERLFERFYRADSATAGGVPGVGLGLTIVQAIVQGHGGEIDLHSVPGEGTTFSVRLPRRRRSDLGLNDRAAPARAGAAPEG